VVAIERSADGSGAAVVEVNSETDFVAREGDFRAFAAAVARAALEARPADVAALGAVRLPSGQTIDETRRALVARLGENIGVRRFELVDGRGGPLGSYLHGTRIGALVALTGGNDALARDLAMHVAAINPQFVAAEDVPADLVAREREIFLAQIAGDPKAQGKPAEIVAKMVDGKVRKFVGEITLTGQPFVKDDKIAVGEVLKRAKAGVLRFVRFEVGAGIEKKQENFRAEVMAQVRGG
jgi:elongation factor Ts